MHVYKWLRARDHRLTRRIIPYILSSSQNHKDTIIHSVGSIYDGRYINGLTDGLLAGLRNTCYETFEVKSYLLDVPYLDWRYGVRGWHPLSLAYEKSYIYIWSKAMKSWPSSHIECVLTLYVKSNTQVLAKIYWSRAFHLRIPGHSLCLYIERYHDAKNR